jgi:non-specific serine/threonine protein kinase
LGYRFLISDSLGTLGIAALNQGDYTTARALLEESLAIAREIGSKFVGADLLEGIAALALSQQQARRSAQLFGAASALRQAMGAAPLLPVEQSEVDAHQTTLRDTLGEEAFTAAWEAGRAMTWEAAVAYALEEESEPTSTSP